MCWKNPASRRPDACLRPFVSETVCKCLRWTLLNFCFLPPQHCSASGLQPHLCARARSRQYPPVINSLCAFSHTRSSERVRACARVKSPAARSKQEQTGMNQTEQPPTAVNRTSRVTILLLIGGGRDTDRKAGSDWRVRGEPRPYLDCHVVCCVKGKSEGTGR